MLKRDTAEVIAVLAVGVVLAGYAISRPGVPATSPVAHEAAHEAAGGSNPPIDVPSDFKAPTPYGWLRVGGPKCLGHRVIVDGLVIGLAPLELTLPLGRHDITVDDPQTSHRYVRKTVRIREAHTRVFPLRVLR